MGMTDLLGAGRVHKHSLRVECYGTIDETNAWIGFVRASGPPTDVDADLERVARNLFTAGADLATPSLTLDMGRLTIADLEFLEVAIDRYEAELFPLTNFVLAGGAPIAAALHIARTVCRRAERVATSVAVIESVNTVALAYLNRLSDLLFVLARVMNARSGIADVVWSGADRS
jgi:cob(I)alamin adenosyltransferase